MDQPATSDSGKGRHAVILCHPDSQSFNRSIANAYCEAVRANGQEAVLRDLYDMDFDPVLRAWERPTVSNFTVSPDVSRELAILRTCDVLVLVYPIWFGTPPAMMKGYVERVLGSGVDPKSVVSRTPTSFLAGRRLLSFTTSATSAPWLNEQGEWLALRHLFDHYLTNAFGMQADEHVHFASITSGLQPRWAEQHLYDVTQHAHRTCALVAADHREAAALVDKQDSTAA
jgi:NAD(P)H dehydrogenase (quinone)